MAITQLTQRQFKSLIRESVKEALGVELTKMRAALLPFVSEKEQRDVVRLYRKPSRKIVSTYYVKI
ncbi:MAG: hypothetical protein A3C46_00570 [Deltaproteobacteria bacterium RIFCSPHIGHO2_02_FULL_44_16]|nr:MAG: hypothetical protein A3C46_00570 [Deltaproteobacteria bacterium RIFCSPHIGHO2_02_FULL_44_16]